MTFNSELRKRDDLSEYQKQARSLWFHKMHVIKAGLLVGGISLRRLLVHDASKLTLVEFASYSRFKYGAKLEKDAKPEQHKKRIEEWGKAWSHHVHNNKHHPECWILSWRGDPNFYDGVGLGLAPFVTVLPIPETYTREFVIDMMATSMEITGSYDIAVWLNANGPKINMHPDTEIALDAVLTELGYFLTDNCPWSYMAGDITRNRFAMEGATK